MEEGEVKVSCVPFVSVQTVAVRRAQAWGSGCFCGKCVERESSGVARVYTQHSVVVFMAFIVVYMGVKDNLNAILLFVVVILLQQ